jgi:hypothetical protein
MIWLLVRHAGGHVELPKDWADLEESAGTGIVKVTHDDGSITLSAI